MLKEAIKRAVWGDYVNKVAKYDDELLKKSFEKYKVQYNLYKDDKDIFMRDTAKRFYKILGREMKKRNLL